MSRIAVETFLGIAPKVASTHLQFTQAQIAKDARLWSRAVRPFKGLAFPTDLSKPTGEIKTIWSYNNNATWLCWTQDVNACRWPVAGDTLEKLVFTGTDKPRVTTKDLFDDGTPGTNVPPASYILGIPAPDTAPVATDSAAGNIATGTYTWVFTFVRTWSDGTKDEGPPSVPSNVLTLTGGRQASVTLPNGGMATPGDYGITHKKLYRSQGGAYFFVAEVTIGTSPTTDNIATPDLGPELTTTFFLPPPDGMIGAIELSNGVIAGFKDNLVYLSEPYRPWAYPLLNQYAVAWPIVAIGGYGSSVIVATKGYPYIGRGIDPAAYAFVPNRGAYYPCASKRSLATGPQGVYWATPDGLVLASEGGVNNITKRFITHNEWSDFRPDTMHGMVHEGRYYAWFNEPTGTDQYGNKAGGGIIFDPAEEAFLCTLGRHSQASYVRPDTGELWVSQKGTNMLNQVFAFDADPSNPFTYEWKSKVFITPGLENFAFAQIHARFGDGLSSEELADLLAQIAAVVAFNSAQPTTDGSLNEPLLNDMELNGDSILLDAPSAEFVAAGVIFQYWADGVLKLQRTVDSKEPFPLPSGFRAEKHEFSVAGEIETQQVVLATSVEELASI